MKQNRFSRWMDTITTFVRITMTVFFTLIVVLGYVGTNAAFTKSERLLENMPDGNGVADGYIVLGKVFGSIGSGVAGMVYAVIFLAGCIIAVTGAIFSILYLIHRWKYKRTADDRFLKRNFLIKTIVNGIRIILFFWFMVENSIYSTVFLTLLFVIIITELLLILSWRSFSKQSL